MKLPVLVTFIISSQLSSAKGLPSSILLRPMRFAKSVVALIEPLWRLVRKIGMLYKRSKSLPPLRRSRATALPDYALKAWATVMRARLVHIERRNNLAHCDWADPASARILHGMSLRLSRKSGQMSGGYSGITLIHGVLRSPRAVPNGFQSS